MKKAKVKKDIKNGLWDVIRPDNKIRWFYTKQDAIAYANYLNNKKQTT